jgi:hypothetical protein
MKNKDKMIQENTEEEEDKKSISSVLNFSLDSTKEINKQITSNENIFDIKEELMDKVHVPIENELDESEEFLLEGKENEIRSFFYEEKANSRKRSQTFVPKNNRMVIHKPIREEPKEYMSPLKLSRKTFGNISKFNQKPNDVLCDFQKYILDNKSCNDEDSSDDFFLLYSETERSTPNHEDLENLLDCRKKMILFKNTINDRTIKEYENILNSDNIFMKENKNNMSSYQQRKSNFWNKHIRQKLKNEDDGLLILGILESAANERKGRHTVNV